VLIDFSSSIVSKETIDTTMAGSPIARKAPGRFHSLHRWLEGDNVVAREHIMRLVEMLPTSSRVLVVGGAAVGKGTEYLYDSGLAIASFDIYASDHTDLVADAHRIPFADASFDAAIVQAVLEHVLEPAAVVAEVHRILKPDGIVYAETPFLQHVHEGPYDFHRFTDSGHRWLFRNFELLDSGVVAGAGYQALWSVDHLARNLFRSTRAGRLFRRMLAYPLQLAERRSRSTPYAVDAASCVYFFGRRSEVSISPADIVEYYQGAQRTSA
jgi:SAM-dependent methyltransferase